MSSLDRHTPIPITYRRLEGEEDGDEQGFASPPTWPRTWNDASSWVSRDPHVASSLTQSFTRTRNPQIMELEHQEEEEQGRSPLFRHGTSFSPSEAQGDGLEESLLFDYEAEAVSAVPAVADGLQGQSLTNLSRDSPQLDSIVLESIKETPVYTVRVEQEHATSSTWQAAFNAVNVLCGVGLLVTPYATATSGVASLLLLVMIGGIACYTGYMLSQCMNSCRSIRSYPDIGEKAFGRPGRLLVSVLLYLELFCCSVDFMILEGDNLSALFPGPRLHLGGLGLTAQQTMVLIAAGVILPSVWLRDLSLLSFISVGGIFASMALIGLVGWEGATITGFPHTQPPLLVWSDVPVALGLYSFCFSGHAVFPSLYSSMRHKHQFPRLLVVSFSVVVLMYGMMAVLGVMMFGPSISENITLDMQEVAPTAVPTRFAMWLVIVNPLTKLALTLTPVAMAFEELITIPHNSWQFGIASLCLRTALLAVTVLVAVVVPFFAFVMSFIGAFLSMSISIVLPCLFYCKICQAKLQWPQYVAAGAVALFGVVAGTTATYQAVTSIWGRF